MQDLYIKYNKKDNKIDFGQTKGSIIEITIKPPSIVKETKETGITRISAIQEDFDNLISGKKMIDVNKTTLEHCYILDKKDPYRLAATNFILKNEKDIEEYSEIPKENDAGIYKNYVKAFLEEFTRCTKHIPFAEKIKVYPLPLLTPCNVEVLVGKDGVCFIFSSESRPEKVSVSLDINKIIEELLLPHPTNRRYSSYGPNTIFNFICSDENFIHVVGDGNAFLDSMLGNPVFLIFEKSFHGYYSNMNFIRNYPDTGLQVKKKVEYCEIFGNNHISNFSLENARSRARIVAYKSILSSVTGNVNKVEELKNVLIELKNKINNDVGEIEIEKFIDSNKWILEKGIGCQKYFSQISIPKDLLYDADGGIKPDKYMMNNDGYCDILDLKKPSAKLIVIKNNRSHQSSSLTEAEAQIDKYIDFSREPKVRDYLLTLNIKITKPDGIVLIGRTPKEYLKEWIDIKKRLQIKVYTYDDLVNNLDNLIDWIDKILTI